MQELGGDMLFGTRLGFSGTPADLLPDEFGACRWAEGDDARMLHVLTDPTVVSYQAALGKGRSASGSELGSFNGPTYATELPSGDVLVCEHLRALLSPS